MDRTIDAGFRRTGHVAPGFGGFAATVAEASGVGAHTNQRGDPEPPRALGEPERSVVEGELELVAVVGRRCASRRDRRNGRSEPDVVEDVCGEVGVGEECEHGSRRAGTG